jgi:HKD family nuclease
MNAVIHGQVPNDFRTSLSATLSRICHREECSHVRIAVAYATVEGVLEFLEILRPKSGMANLSYEWLLGLDDFLTHPGAVRLCQSLANSNVRTASLSASNCRFHPKLMFFSSKTGTAIAIVGSNNLTHRALTQNCEAYAVIQSRKPTDQRNLDSVWKSIWNLGKPIREQELREYEHGYRRRVSDNDDNSTSSTARRLQSNSFGAGGSVQAETDPTMAQTCWIEVGKNTAQGRELEFKAEQAMFFGLNPIGSNGERAIRVFTTSAGDHVEMALKFQGNSMWRLQMNSHVPEVQEGLRPRDPKTGKLGRSSYVAVFSRTNKKDRYVLRFIEESSREYADLKRESLKRGMLGTTSARAFGWY